MKRIILFISIVIMFSCNNRNKIPPAPSLISPEDKIKMNVTVSGKTVYFEWTPSVDGYKNSGYTWYGCTNSEFKGASYHSVQTNSTTAFIPQCGQYYWRVQAYDKNGNKSEFSETYYIDISNDQAPSIPILLYPYNNAVFNSTEIIFEWEHSIDPQGDPINYVLHIDTDSIISTGYGHGTTENYKKLTLERGKTYYWVLYAEDEDNNRDDYSEKRSFRITSESENQVPSVPILVFPEDNIDCLPINITFNWNPSTDFENDIVNYKLIISTSSNFDENVAEYNTGTQTDYNVTLLYNQKYYWKIKAWDSHNHVYSKVRNLETHGEVNQNTVPLLQYISPENNSKIESSSVTIKWQGSDNETSNSNLLYKVYFAEDNNSLNLIQEGNITQKTVTGLISGKTYKWQIYVTDEDNATTIGETWRFSVQ